MGLIRGNLQTGKLRLLTQLGEIPIQSGLHVHYDGSALNAQYSDGERIDTWSDRADNDFDATASGDDRPILVEDGTNGLSVAEFNSSEQNIMEIEVGLFDIPEYSFVCVTDNVVLTGQHVVLGNESTNFSYKGHYYFRESTDEQIAIHGDRSDNVSNPMVVSFVEDGGESGQVRKNGVDIHTADIEDGENVMYHLGYDPSAASPNYYDGWLCEYAAWNRVLESEEVTEVENYLMDKWGIQ